jgi:hypothetical protein
MKKASLFLVVIVAAGGLTFAAQAGEPQATKPAEVSNTASKATCKKGLSITLSVGPDGLKQYTPRPPWSVKENQWVEVTNNTPKNVCINLVREGHKTKRYFLPSNGNPWNDDCKLAKGKYTLAACYVSTTDCPSDCGNLTDTQAAQGGPDTIKGELTVNTSN